LGFFFLNSFDYWFKVSLGKLVQLVLVMFLQSLVLLMACFDSLERCSCWERGFALSIPFFVFEFINKQIQTQISFYFYFTWKINTKNVVVSSCLGLWHFHMWQPVSVLECNYATLVFVSIHHRIFIWLNFVCSVNNTCVVSVHRS
jgi:hypothetical protein